MKTKTLLSALVTFLFLNLTAQQWQWALKMSTAANDGGRHLANDAFGNIYLAAKSGYSMCDVISKHQTNGNLLWARSEGNSDIEGITTDKVGNVYVIARIGTNTVFDGGNNNNITVNSAFPATDVVLVKYNTQGDIQWAQVISEPGANTYLYDVKCDAQGNPIVSGRSEKDNNGYTFNYFISKYNTSGGLLWTKNSNWKGNVVGKTLAIDEAGNCYIAGNFNDSAFFGNTVLTASAAYDSPAFLAKYDYNGTVLWVKKITTGWNNCSALYYRNGKLVITGSYMPQFAIGNQSLGGPTNSGDHLYIAQFDTAGNFFWAKSALYAQGYGIILDKDNSSIVTGSFKSPNAIFGSGTATVTLSTQKINEEIFLAKYDSLGLLKWAIAPGGNYGGGNSAMSITQSNNNYIVTGDFTEMTVFGSTTLNAPTSSCGSSDVFLAAIKDTVSNIVTSINENENTPFVLWPNPSTDYLYFTAQQHKNSSTLKIYNILGQIVYNQALTVDTARETEKISVADYLPGVYIVEIYINERKYSSRFIKK